jgi:hypothetical protein
MDRQRYLEALHREANDYSTGTNISTIMHEVAHLLTFNCGMFNREGDVPLWLAEGSACFCEATRNGSWQGPGEPSPSRVHTLAEVVRERGQLLSLRELLESNAWREDKRGHKIIAIGYAQSWALFRLLIQERPEAMRTYLRLIYSRRTPDRRLADFQQAFGTDLFRLERRYGEYLQELVQQHGSAKR